MNTAPPSVPTRGEALMAEERPAVDPAGRELMELDLDADSAAPWPFDLGSAPLSPILLSPSPPQGLGLGPFHFPSPPSPLWLFEDRANEIPEMPRFLYSNPDITSGNFKGGSGKPRQLQICVAEDDSDTSCVIKERMTQALRYFKESTDQHVLVQVWAPVKNGDQYVLTTSGQPFVLDPQSDGLLQYRTVSLTYKFSVDGENDGDLGLPGRVFRHKLPEWTPNVQYYTSKEYPRLSHAVNYNVKGSLALPVFEPSGQVCVGVVELIMTLQKINYASEVDKVCKALEAVNLKSSEILEHPIIQICNEGRQVALVEILEILTVVCEAHTLPLAQTWVPCRHRSVLAHGGGLKKNCSSFDGSCMGQVCMSTTDVAFYVIDAHMWGFRDACVEHHLQKGQGVAGRAFEFRKPFFCRDVTQFCKTEYPLVHYAKMFGLASCLAICLQSTQTGDDDYVLEFFLSPDCKDTSEQQALLDSISTMIKQHFRSLKVVTDVDIQEGMSIDIIDMLGSGSHGLKPEHIHSTTPETHACASPEHSPFEGPGDSQNEENLFHDLQEQHSLEDANAEKNENIALDSIGSGTSGSLLGNKASRTPERRRGKAEKSISLDVLQQYFAGSLKDAAKSLGGKLICSNTKHFFAHIYKSVSCKKCACSCCTPCTVCPTTMKRICRQHGISRWPSRKIKKVSRSLSKLKRVIESVQVVEGALNLTPLTCPLPVTVGSISWPVGFDESKQSNGVVRDKEPSPRKIPGCNPPCNSYHLSPQELIHDHAGSQPEPATDSPCSKTRSFSGEGSENTPPSHDSYHESPVNENHLGNQLASSKLEQGADIKDPLGYTSGLPGDPNLPTVFLMPDAIIAEPQTHLSGMLIEDAGSSKDLNNLCPFAGEGCKDEQLNALAPNPLQSTLIQDTRTVTIKASYREDIIRFRFPCTAGVAVLKNEVAKRLKVDVGLFDIKYLDDDHEWVMLACDADLEECMEISRLSGGRLIRLSVHDIGAALGSSCESSG